MIFITVGTQLGFDRLIKFMDEFANNNPTLEYFAQIAQGEYIPKQLPYCRFLTAKQHNQYISKSDVVISHAGMGTIINCLVLSKPIILLPRKACLNEHRNDHQLSTVKKFSNANGCFIVLSESDISTAIKVAQHFRISIKRSQFAPEKMIKDLRSIIESE